MTVKRATFFVMLVALVALCAPSVEAADISGHWVSVGITAPGQKETMDLFEGFPVRLCAHYQLNPGGTFEAVIFGAWFRGTWVSDGEDGALLTLVQKAETDEVLPEKLTVKEGQIVYKDGEGLVFRLGREQKKLDVDALLEEIQAELE